MSYVQVKLNVTLNNNTLLNIFLICVNFDKPTIRLDFFIIPYILTNYQNNLILITMSPIKCLNFKILYFIKLWIKMVFYIKY